MGNDEILKVELEKAVAECERLREANARLRVRVDQASRSKLQIIGSTEFLSRSPSTAIVVQLR